MRTCLVLSLLVTSVGSAAAQPLTIANVTLTRGLLGSNRDSTSLVAGDTLALAFDISGLTSDKEGRVRFSTQFQVEAADGKVQFVDTQEGDALGNVLGGPNMRHVVQVATALDQQPGNYVLKLTIIDRLAKAAAPTAKFEQRFSVKKPEFALVRLQWTADAAGKVPVGNVGTRGGQLFLQGVAIGYGLDKEQQGGFQVEMAVKDGGGKPVTAEFREIPKDTKFLPLRFDVPLNRSGQFTLTLKATDLATKATTSVSLPLRVLD